MAKTIPDWQVEACENAGWTVKEYGKETYIKYLTESGEEAGLVIRPGGSLKEIVRETNQIYDVDNYAEYLFELSEEKGARIRISEAVEAAKEIEIAFSDLLHELEDAEVENRLLSLENDPDIIYDPNMDDLLPIRFIDDNWMVFEYDESDCFGTVHDYRWYFPKTEKAAAKIKDAFKFNEEVPVKDWICVYGESWDEEPIGFDVSPSEDNEFYFMALKEMCEDVEWSIKKTQENLKNYLKSFEFPNN